jgi:hypothetical protein
LYFGTLPRHFLLTNLLAMPLTGLIIPALIVTLVLSGAGLCPTIVVQITEWLTSSLIRILEIIAMM